MINKEQTKFSNASNEGKVTGKKNLSLHLRFEARPALEESVIECHEVYDKLEDGLSKQLTRSSKLGLQDVEEIRCDVIEDLVEDRLFILTADIDFREDINETEALNLAKLITREFCLPRCLELDIEDTEFVLRDAGSEELLRVGYL